VIQSGEAVSDPLAKAPLPLSSTHYVDLSDTYRYCTPHVGVTGLTPFLAARQVAGIEAWLLGPIPVGKLSSTSNDCVSISLGFRSQYGVCMVAFWPLATVLRVG